MSDIEIKGALELERALKELPDKIARNILRAALRAGGKVILERARAEVPVQSGALRDSLRVSTSLRGGVARASVKAGSGRAYYAHMVEFGTRRHWIKPKNRKSLFFAGIAREVIDHPGANDKPFMRPAFEQGASAATDAVADYIRKRLEKLAAKA